ncbi:MAG: cupin domain-containing protein [Candidatus Binataceae bacterium]
MANSGVDQQPSRRRKSAVAAEASAKGRTRMARAAAPMAAAGPAIKTPSLGAPPVLRRLRRNFRWEHAEVEPYKIAARGAGEFAGASRQVLIGKRGERAAFHLRYFELEPEGYTSLERHRHVHVVIGVRGRGLVRVGNREYRLAPHDLIYIGPGQVHQLRSAGRAKFGFFCIVNAHRDKPRAVKPAGSARLKTSSGAM